jgi:hypothetical protein
MLNQHDEPMNQTQYESIKRQIASIGTNPAGLGCGTLILIALIVLFFSRPGIGEMETKVSNLQLTVEALRKASEIQTHEIRELRKTVEEQRKGSEKNK